MAPDKMTDRPRRIEFRVDGCGICERPFNKKPLQGSAVYTPGFGWRFFPSVAGRQPSKKSYPTLEACLPRWIGYPDRNCSQEVSR
jgi:hypothetical protein